MNFKRLFLKGAAKVGFDAAKKALAKRKQKEEDEQDASEAATVLENARNEDRVLWEELSTEDETVLESPEYEVKTQKSRWMNDYTILKEPKKEE